MLGLRLGMKVITLPKFDPEMYVKALTAYKPTLLNLVPPLVSFLASDHTVKPHHLASLKFVSGGAAPFGPTLINKFMKKCAPNTPIFQEAQLRDQEREVALKEAEEESRLQEQVEEAKRRSEQEAREAEEREKARQVREAELTLPPEPAVDSGAPLANIRFRTPSETFARRFLASDPLSILLLFLRSKGYRPEEYKVLSTFPRRDLSSLPDTSSLEVLKLCPQETLTLEAISSGDSDSE